MRTPGENRGGRGGDGKRGEGRGADGERGRKGERERGREGERERRREGETERVRDGERERGRESGGERGGERELLASLQPPCSRLGLSTIQRLDVCAFLCLAQVILRATSDHIVPVVYEV